MQSHTVLTSKHNETLNKNRLDSGTNFIKKTETNFGQLLQADTSRTQGTGRPLVNDKEEAKVIKEAGIEEESDKKQQKKLIDGDLEK